ncbi:HECT-like ubiquitin-conjugating enzyme-binding-domain-containing protein [Infundibulicybe gibba]|nr:HECT-like ubiquitin-conjugating enzyme-binding-domain-containing protein [Infundibulicybe gibba]
MATLTRSRDAPTHVANPALALEIPTPFPREQLIREQSITGSKAYDTTDDLDQERGAGPSQTLDGSEAYESTASGDIHEVMPSISYVQRSCLMTLNNLLSAPTHWTPIVPDRRHSMPPTPNTSTSEQMHHEYPSALQTLVSNLRNRCVDDNMIEYHPSSTEADMIHELRTRVQTLSPTLDSDDFRLASALISSQTVEQPAPANLFDTLKRQLSELQLERQSSQSGTPTPGAPPVLAVETALLWSQIDEELESVVAMCKQRAENLPRFSTDHLPPQYDPDDYLFEALPEYESGHHPRVSLEDKSYMANPHHSPIVAGGQPSEKMRLDLEAVAMAIDRLYLVAPQLHNQRVELKTSKLEQMERARREGAKPVSPISKGKQKASEMQELENIFDMLGKASNRSLLDQSVILDGGMQARLERARQRDSAKRDTFIEQLAKHSDAGRLHEQDALRPKMKDPETLLSLPEFIKESVPLGSVRLEDPTTMLTLPEFVKEPPPPHIVSSDSPTATLKTKKKSRSRSLSAPSLSWLRHSSKAGVSTIRYKSSHSRSRSRGSNTTPSSLEVTYVAENHDSLQHILVFFNVTGAVPGVDIEAEIVPTPKHGCSEGNRLVIRSGTNTSSPLYLPAHTSLGKKDVKVQSGHFEIKLPTLAPPVDTPSEDISAPLLDASQLVAINPTSFICASCSLPLVYSHGINTYRDLPSEHWEELVDAWMCHSDQKLHQQVTSHGKGGFWPQPSQALVGGSYILFEESSLAKNNLHVSDRKMRGEQWRLVRCLCGAVVGRCQEHSDNGQTSIVYRLLKYAIRPVSPTSEPSRISLSAFIIEDMVEFVQAHATYRFVILDEEEERPRILVWLFKPNIQLSYSVSTSYAIPRTASIRAAKVLFKLLGPLDESADLNNLLNKYPGFPQAEYLFYPRDICHRLAGLLKESNASYPLSMRTMTGLEVGWLHRA